MSANLSSESPNPTVATADLSLDAALVALRQLVSVEQVPTASAAPPAATLRAALALVRDHSDYQIFGICADSIAQGQQALERYLAALGYGDAPAIPAVEGPVYIKYNPKLQRCHADGYTGHHRGVLVSCQSAYDGDINETFGHLPLDLFDAG
jgi:Domain of unknown function (DUF1824)